MKAIIYRQFDGSLGIIYPAVKTDIDVLAKTHLDIGTPYSIVEISELVIDNIFFNAYEYDDLAKNKLKFNFEKAHKIWKDKWRKIRDKKLQQLDIEFMKAVEAGDPTKQQNIAKLKQQYRDITKTVLPHEINDIKRVWPEILK